MARPINVVVACVAISLLMTACATSPIIEGTATQICRTWKPVFTSKSDKLTDDTVRQIVGNNEANRAWCGDSGPPPRPAVKTS